MTQKVVNQISYDIVGCCFSVHKNLGPGLLESTYEQCLFHLLQKKGFRVEKQQVVSLEFEGIVLPADLRCDLLVENLVVCELKSIESLLPIHTAQILTYMKLLKCPKGLLINFNTASLRQGLVPLVNEYFARLPCQ